MKLKYKLEFNQVFFLVVKIRYFIHITRGLLHTSLVNETFDNFKTLILVSRMLFLVTNLAAKILILVM